MTDEEEIKLTPYRDSPWWKFMEETKGFDYYNHKPSGWGWFWAIRYLSNDPYEAPYPEIEAIQAKLPDGHWLKKLNPDFKNLDKINSENRKDGLFIIADNFVKTYRLTRTVNFSKLQFNSWGLFSNFIFLLDVSFDETEFLESADFCNSVFWYDANFTNTKFLQDVHFDDAIFFDTANFKGAEFHGKTAKFKNTIFKKIADFTNTKFEAYANFKGSKLKGRTSFQRAKFKFHAPRFYGAEFNNEMTFFGMVPPKFFSIFPPKLIRTSDEKLDKSPKNITTFWIDKKKKKKKYRQRIQENQNSYENTAILLEEKKKYHDQHFFFRQEMTCRRRIERRVAIRFSFWLYEKLANYGYGIDRALFWWATHIVFGVLVIATIYGDMSFQKNLPCAISVSFANANPYAFFGFDSVKLAECYDMFNVQAPISFAIIKVIQTIVGVGLLFLVLLTLRIRFRLK